MFRGICSVILAFSVLFLPFWCTVIIFLVCVGLIKGYYEAPFILLLGDVVYGIPLDIFNNMMIVMALAAIVVIIVAEFVKQKLIIYGYS